MAPGTNTAALGLRERDDRMFACDCWEDISEEVEENVGEDPRREGSR